MPMVSYFLLFWLPDTWTQLLVEAVLLSGHSSGPSLDEGPFFRLRFYSNTDKLVTEINSEQSEYFDLVKCLCSLLPAIVSLRLPIMGRRPNHRPSLSSSSTASGATTPFLVSRHTS